MAIKGLQKAEWDSTPEVFGNVGVRNIVITEGSELPGHMHNYPHATFVSVGSVEVDFEFSDGSIKTEQFGERDIFEVPANVKHTIRSASKGGSVCRCVFAVRDEDGEVVYNPTNKQIKSRHWGERAGYALRGISK